MAVVGSREHLTQQLRMEYGSEIGLIVYYDRSDDETIPLGVVEVYAHGGNVPSQAAVDFLNGNSGMRPVGVLFRSHLPEESEPEEPEPEPEDPNDRWSRSDDAFRVTRLNKRISGRGNIEEMEPWPDVEATGLIHQSSTATITFYDDKIPPHPKRETILCMSVDLVDKGPRYSTMATAHGPMQAYAGSSGRVLKELMIRNLPQWVKLPVCFEVHVTHAGTKEAIAVGTLHQEHIHRDNAGHLVISGVELD